MDIPFHIEFSSLILETKPSVGLVHRWKDLYLTRNRLKLWVYSITNSKSLVWFCSTAWSNYIVALGPHVCRLKSDQPENSRWTEHINRINKIAYIGLFIILNLSIFARCGMKADVVSFNKAYVHCKIQSQIQNLCASVLKAKCNCFSWKPQNTILQWPAADADSFSL